MPCWSSRQPASGVLIPSDERGWRGRIELALEALVALLEFQDLDDVSRLSR
jgi:hypothetical protein